MERVSFGIAIPRLKDFVKDCWLSLFGGAHTRMMFTWKNFRRPEQEEVEWYNMIWGSRRANTFFTRFNESRQILKNDESHKTVKEYINMYDKELQNKFESMLKEYRDLIKNYPYPCDTLLEIVYPQFLRENQAKHKI